MPDELTRQAAMEAAYNLPGLELPMLLPGVTVTTSGVDDPFPIESMRMGEWNGEYFDYVGELTSFEGPDGRLRRLSRPARITTDPRSEGRPCQGRPSPRPGRRLRRPGNG